MHVILDLPAQLPLLPTVTAVATWAAHTTSPFGADPAWRLVVDEATIGLVPVGPETTDLPALLLMPLNADEDSGVAVTVCDPDDPVELGLFTTIEDALDGIARWLGPRRAGRILH